MTVSQEFFDRARAASDAGRLAPGPMTRWDVFPFESVTVAPLTELELPESVPGTDAESCKVCEIGRNDEHRLWAGQHFWVARRHETSLLFWGLVAPRAHRTLDELGPDELAEMGQVLGRTFTAVSALDGVGRVHLNKWENTTGHLMWNVLARPEGVLQLRGSNLPVWADMLPPTPEPDLARRADEVSHALVAFDG